MGHDPRIPECISNTCCESLMRKQGKFIRSAAIAEAVGQPEVVAVLEPSEFVYVLLSLGLLCTLLEGTLLEGTLLEAPLLEDTLLKGILLEATLLEGALQEFTLQDG